MATNNRYYHDQNGRPIQTSYIRRRRNVCLMHTWPLRWSRRVPAEAMRQHVESR